MHTFQYVNDEENAFQVVIGGGQDRFTVGSVPVQMWSKPDDVEGADCGKAMSRVEFIEYLEANSDRLPNGGVPVLTEVGHPELYKLVEESVAEYKAGECEEI